MYFDAVLNSDDGRTVVLNDTPEAVRAWLEGRPEQWPEYLVAEGRTLGIFSPKEYI